MKPSTLKTRWLFPSLAAIICLALYPLTMAPGLSWAHHSADGGDLVAAATGLGVPHPPGYALYTLLAQPLVHLPAGNPAWRMNLYSALAAAATIFFLCDLFSLAIPAHKKPVLRWVLPAAALAAGSSTLLWSQAVITEVYALAALFCVLTLRQALLVEKSNSGWLALGLLQALAVLGHPTLALLIPGILIIVWPHLSWHRLARALTGIAAGLVPLVYIPLAARGNPATNWGSAATWDGFLWLTSGAAYQELAFALPSASLIERLRALAGVALGQYGIAGTVLAIVGLQQMIQTHRRLLLATVVISAGLAAFAILYGTSDSFVYLLPVFLIEGLWIAIGLQQIAELLFDYGVPLALVGILALPLLNVAQHYAQVDASQDTEASDWYEATLEAAPAGAIIISCDDRHTFALGYARQSLGLREDVLLIDADLWLQPWYAQEILQREGLDAGLAGLPSAQALPEIRPDAARLVLCTRPELASASSAGDD